MSRAWSRCLRRQACLLMVTLAVGWAPAPLPRPPRVPPMAGSWDVKWVDLDARLELRPDGSARFTYTKAAGQWDGSWQYDQKARRLTLTLLIAENNPHTYILTFKRIEADLAEGTLQRGNPLLESVKLMRAKRK